MHRSIGYKLLGFVVWHGGKWYVRRRYPGIGRKAAIGAGAVAAGLLAAGIAVTILRQQGSEEG